MTEETELQKIVRHPTFYVFKTFKERPNRTAAISPKW